MKNRVKTFFCGVIILVLLPLVVTMLFQGEAIFPDITKEEPGVGEASTEEQQWDTTEIEGKVIAVLAKEISVNSEREAIKAQSVVIRTNIIGARLSGGTEPAGLTTEEMLKQFGEENFQKCYEKLAELAGETEGIVMTHNHKVIEAPYFAVSAGKTRSAADAFGKEEVAYLKSVESKSDIGSEEFLRVEFLKPEEFITACNTAFADAGVVPQDIMSQIEIISRDGGEYVKEMRVGQIHITGEEFRNALGLHSACFTIKEVEGEIRIVTKGYGHGVGLSRYGANEMAKEGKGYEEILKKYFTDIKLTEYKKAE